MLPGRIGSRGSPYSSGEERGGYLENHHAPSYNPYHRGPIFGAVHIGTDGKWLARHWGRQLDGGRICSSVDEADAYLMDSFWQMFPGHECSQQCLAQLKPV